MEKRGQFTFYVREHRPEAFILLFFDDLNYPVVDRCRNSVLFAPLADDTVDGVEA